MSYTFLQEQGEESSAECYSAMCQCAPLNWKNTHVKSCSSDNEKESCHGSQSGTMFAPSTGSHGEGESMSCVGDSRVRTSAPQAQGKASQGNALASGKRWPASLAKWDRDTSSWKIPQPLLVGDSEQFSGTWPKWGSMRNGECSGRTTPRLPTSERGSGFWPTLTASIGAKSGGRHRGKPDTLASMLAMREGLSVGSTGRVNPMWSEWLMGFPANWSAIEPSETPRFHEWLHSHGKPSCAA